MPKYIIKLHDEKYKKDYYMEWSTIIDAPVTYGCSLAEFKKYYKDEYGSSGMKQLAERLKRVEETGTSSYMDNLEGLLECNRAGKNESHISKEAIIKKYCRSRNP